MNRPRLSGSRTTTKWEIRCPRCGLVESLRVTWPTANKRCWRELPFHASDYDTPCYGTGLVVESEPFETPDAEHALEHDLMDIMRTQRADGR
jgi:hypothetical protein